MIQILRFLSSNSLDRIFSEKLKLKTDVDSIHDEDFDNDAIVSGFLRNMLRWDKLTLVVVEKGKMQNNNKQLE